MPLETLNFSNKGLEGGESFTPTPDELQTIRRKMDDPKFMELFQEYMKSMEDPKTRLEEEAYLQQVEREAREGGDFSFDFIFPRSGFVVELLEPMTSHRVKAPLSRGGQPKGNTRTRVYVNMCSSEKIDPFREETTGDRNSSNWLVPVSISKPRTELFSEEENHTVGKEGPKDEGSVPDAVVVYDAVFHPHTLQLADRSDRFCCFLVNIAVEHINTGYGDSHGFQFRRLGSEIKVVGTLQSQTVRREKGKSPFEVAAKEPVLRRPTQKLPGPSDVTTDQSSRSCLPAKGTSRRAEQCSDDTGGRKDNRETRGGSAPEWRGDEDNMPQHTIAHRGNVDLSDAWGWKIVDRRIGVPEALVVKMEFVGVHSASALDVEVEGTYVKVRRSNLHAYHGSLLLPFTVDPTPLEAKFECKRNTLTLVLRVIPPAPTEITAVEMRRQLMHGCDDDASPHTSALADERPDVLHGDKKMVDSTGGDVDLGLASLPEEGHTTAATPQPQARGLENSEGSPPAPQFGTVSDRERVQQVMEKVQAARRERERAEREDMMKRRGEGKEGGVVATATEDCEPINSELVDKVDDCGGRVHEPVTMSAVPAKEGSVEENKKGEEELESLKQRQDAWRQSIQQRIDVAEEEERRAAQRVEQEAQREAERLKRRANLAKLQEAAEAKLRECMADVPLSNKHIFAID